MFAAIAGSLDGTLAGLATSIGTLADAPQSLADILTYTPVFVDELGRTFDGGAAWSSTQGVPGIPYSPVYGIPIVGSGIRIDKLVLPTIAKRITADFRSQQPASVIRLVSPEEAAAASG